MISNRLSSSPRIPKQESQPSGSGTKQAGAKPSNPPSKGEAKPSAPALKRVNSLPTHLPSNTPQRTEVKPERKSITRPMPDSYPPEHFKAPGMTTREAAIDKFEAMRSIGDDVKSRSHELEERIKGDKEYRHLIELRLPNFFTSKAYTPKERKDAMQALSDSHPRLNVELGKSRNEDYSIPNYATASRTMNPGEQKFLTNALNEMNKDFQKKPFHMHGEYGVVGDKHGEIVDFNHNPANGVEVLIARGDKYHLHSHPPFGEPFDSSASGVDHREAARRYLDFDNRMRSYITTGKEVIENKPDSFELVKLKPDPAVERELGKFPEGFRLPTPQVPPRPFLNHEAPAALNKNWEPPKGFEPSDLYARAREEAKKAPKPEVWFDPPA